MGKSDVTRRLIPVASAVAAIVTIAVAAPAALASGPYRQVTVMNQWPSVARISICGTDQYTDAQGRPLHVCSPAVAAASATPYTLPNWWWKGSVQILEWDQAGAGVSTICAIRTDQRGNTICAGYVPPPNAPAPPGPIPLPAPNAGYCYARGPIGPFAPAGEQRSLWEIGHVLHLSRRIACDVRSHVSIPVMSRPSGNASVVGHLSKGGYAYWFLFQTKAGLFKAADGSHSNMWAFMTVDASNSSDHQRTWGFVNEAWFAGGQAGASANPAALPVRNTRRK